MNATQIERKKTLWILQSTFVPDALALEATAQIIVYRNVNEAKEELLSGFCVTDSYTHFLPSFKCSGIIVLKSASQAKTIRRTSLVQREEFVQSFITKN